MATFIDKAQILIYLKQDQYDDISQGKDSILDTPMDHAESLIREYLGNRYNIDTVFADPTNTAYLTLRKCCVDIAIYYLYSGQVSPKHIPDFRLMAYEMAMDMLKKYAKGEIGDSLPEITEGDGEAREKAVTSYNELKDTSY